MTSHPLLLIGLFSVLISTFSSCGAEKNNFSSTRSEQLNKEKDPKQVTTNSKTENFDIYDRGFQDVKLVNLKTSTYRVLLNIESSHYRFSHLDPGMVFRKFLISRESLSGLRWPDLEGSLITPVESISVSVKNKRDEKSLPCKIIEVLAEDACFLSGISINPANWTIYLRKIGEGSINNVYSFNKEAIIDKINDKNNLNNLNLVIKVKKHFSKEKDFATLKHEVFAYNLIKQLALLAKFIKMKNNKLVLENLIEVSPVYYDHSSLSLGVKRQNYIDESIPIEQIELALSSYAEGYENTGKGRTKEDVSAEAEQEIINMGFDSAQDAFERLMALNDFYFSTDKLIRKYLKDNQIPPYQVGMGFDMNNRNVLWDLNKKVFIAVDF